MIKILSETQEAIKEFDLAMKRTVPITSESLRILIKKVEDMHYRKVYKVGGKASVTRTIKSIKWSKKVDEVIVRFKGLPGKYMESDITAAPEELIEEVTKQIRQLTEYETYLHEEAFKDTSPNPSDNDPNVDPVFANMRAEMCNTLAKKNSGVLDVALNLRRILQKSVIKK